MFKNSLCVLAALSCCALVTLGQSLNPSAPDYNAPYDTLLARGDKGFNSGKILGVKSPALAMMFYNRAIEIDKVRPEAYTKKATAYLEYDMLDEALENYNVCLEISPDYPACLYGVFYTSFKGSGQYKLVEVPKPMMNQIFKSSLAFLASAPEKSMYQEKGNARLIGNYFKLIMDNKDLFVKFFETNKDEPTEVDVKIWEEILDPVKATNNPYMVASICDRIVSYYFNVQNYAKVKEFGAKAMAPGQVAFTTTYYNLAHTLYYQDNKPDEALAMNEAGLKVGPGTDLENLSADIQYAEGKKAYRAKNYTKAIPIFQKLANAHQDAEVDFAYLSYSFYSLKKYPEAAKNLKALKKVADQSTINILYPNLDALIAFSDKPVGTPPQIKTNIIEYEEHENILEKGEDLCNTKNYDASIEMLNKALAYFEVNKGPKPLSSVYTYLGFCYQNKKEYERAKEYYRKAIPICWYPASYTQLGFLTYYIDGNYTDGEKILLDGLKKFPDHNQLQSKLGELYQDQADTKFDSKDYVGAIEGYHKSLNYIENARIYAFLGLSYYSNNQNDKALHALSYCKDLDPEIVKEFAFIDEVLGKLN